MVVAVSPLHDPPKAPSPSVKARSDKKDISNLEVCNTNVTQADQISILQMHSCHVHASSDYVRSFASYE